MKKEFKAKWIAALKGNTYKQATGFLRMSKLNPKGDRSYIGFCCLGVAMDLMGAKWNEKAFSLGCELNGQHYYSNAQENELKKAFPGIPQSYLKELMNMNDSGIPFPVIADWIEANIKVEQE